MKSKKNFITDYRLMQVKSIAECSKGSILQYFRPSLSYHFPLRPLFCLFLSGRFTGLHSFKTFDRKKCKQHRSDHLRSPVRSSFMRRSRKFCLSGSNLDDFFLVDEGAIIGPPVKCHLNGVSLVCRCWLNIEYWLGSFVIFQGIWTSIA